MLHTALTNLVFTEELFKEVDKLEEEAAYTALMAVAGAVLFCRFVGSGWCVCAEVCIAVITFAISVVVCTSNFCYGLLSNCNCTTNRAFLAFGETCFGTCSSYSRDSNNAVRFLCDCFSITCTARAFVGFYTLFCAGGLSCD